MENFMSGAMMIEAALFSFLLALWMTWAGLRALFVLMPVANRNVQPVRFSADAQKVFRRRNAA
jgi:hypothetical protein